MVATDLASILPIVGGAAAAISGGAAAAWLQVKSQERIEHRRIQREEDVERQQRRERAAELLAEVSALLTEIDTHRTISDLGGHTGDRLAGELRAEVNDLQARQKAVSEQLLLMAIREPSPKVRQLGRDLEKALSGSVRSISMNLTSQLVPHLAPVLADSIARGDQDHLKVQALLDELIEAL